MTSPTAIPARARFARDLGDLGRLRIGLTGPQRERVALDNARMVLQSRGWYEAALFLQYAHPWVQTGETA